MVAYFLILGVISIFIGTFYLVINSMFNIDMDFSKENYVLKDIISDLERERNTHFQNKEHKQESKEESFINF